MALLVVCVSAAVWAAPPESSPQKTVERIGKNASVSQTHHDELLAFALENLIASAEISPSESEGHVKLIRPMSERFLAPGSGFYWQITAEGEEPFTSRSLWDRTLPISTRPAKDQMIFATTNAERGEILRLAEREVLLSGSDRLWRFNVARAIE